MIKEYVFNLANLAINIAMILIFIRVILSWIPAGLGKFRVFIYDTTEPFLKPLRRLVPPVGGVLDLSPIIAYIILQVLQSLLGRL